MPDPQESPEQPEGRWVARVVYFAVLPSSVSALLGGTLLLAGSLNVEYGRQAAAQAVPILLGGLVGLWGVGQTKRTRPTLASVAAASFGPIAFMILLLLDALGITPYGVTPLAGVWD